MQVHDVIAPQPEGMRPPRVVVVDDSAEMRNLVGLALRHFGFDVVAAADGQAALETILVDGADGLVSDLNMPRLDGLTLCRLLRGLSAHATLPIVVFTGATQEDRRVRPLHDIRGVRVLSKPMGLRAIAPALSEMIATIGSRRRTWSEWHLA